MKKFIILLFLFLIFATPVVAADNWTTYQAGMACGLSAYNTMSNCSNLYVNDNNYASGLYPSNDKTSVYYFGDFGIPSGADIQGIKIKIKWYRTGDCGTPSICRASFALTKDTGSTYQYNSVANDLLGDTPSSLGETIVETNDTVSNFNTYGWTPSNFNASGAQQFGVGVDGDSNGTPTYYVDSIFVSVGYSDVVSTAEIVDSVASPSAQLVYLDIAGSTTTAESGEQCRVTLFEHCWQTGVAGWTTETPVAHIMLDEIYKDDTESRKLYGNYFSGYGWGDGVTDWAATNVEVPYEPGYSCDYPMNLVCWDGDRQIVETGNLGVATPSATQSTTPFTEPEPDNPLAWIVWKIKQLLYELFIGSGSDVAWDSYNVLKENLEQRAPFAYAIHIFSFDLSDPATSSAVPSFSYPATVDPNTHEVETLSWSDTTGIVGSTSTFFRTSIKIFLWLIFIVYIFLLGRRIFK